MAVKMIQRAPADRMVRVEMNRNTFGDTGEGAVELIAGSVYMLTARSAQAIENARKGRIVPDAAPPPQEPKEPAKLRGRPAAKKKALR